MFNCFVYSVCHFYKISYRKWQSVGSIQVTTYFFATNRYLNVFSLTRHLCYIYNENVNFSSKLGMHVINLMEEYKPQNRNKEEEEK